MSLGLPQGKLDVSLEPAPPLHHGTVPPVYRTGRSWASEQAAPAGRARPRAAGSATAVAGLVAGRSRPRPSVPPRSGWPRCPVLQTRLGHVGRRHRVHALSSGPICFAAVALCRSVRFSRPNPQSDQRGAPDPRDAVSGRGRLRPPCAAPVPRGRRSVPAPSPVAGECVSHVGRRLWDTRRTASGVSWGLQRTRRPHPSLRELFPVFPFFADETFYFEVTAESRAARPGSDSPGVLNTSQKDRRQFRVTQAQAQVTRRTLAQQPLR